MTSFRQANWATRPKASVKQPTPGHAVKQACSALLRQRFPVRQFKGETKNRLRVRLCKFGVLYS